MGTTKHDGVQRMCVLHGLLCLLVFSPCSGALPPDPDNAALLYYQAFLLCPEPSLAIGTMMDNVSSGAEPDEQIRTYLKECRDTILCAQRAAQVRRCDWGLLYSWGFSCPAPHVKAAGLLSRVLDMDARVLALDGDYRGAFGRCLVMRGLAAHLAGELGRSFGAAMMIEVRVQRCICQILGSTSLDAASISWLKEQFEATPPTHPLLDALWRMDLELALQTARVNETIMQGMRQQLSTAAPGRSIDGGENMSDEELLARVREGCMEFLDSAFYLISSDRPYKETYAEIEALINAREQEIDDPLVNSVMRGILANTVLNSYGSRTYNVAQFSAFSAALDLYLERAKTGKLPESLPDGVPKDPITGKEFLYAVTDEGFLLRSQGEPIEGRPIVQLKCRAAR
jgi:hypothetical protein